MPSAGRCVNINTKSMRKKIIAPPSTDTSPSAEAWLDLEHLAQAEVTSEATSHPIEAALLVGDDSGWCAAQPGPQTIRLRFDRPVLLRHIQLRFREQAQARTQEFTLRWSADGGQTYREVVRQQYTFSLPGTTVEQEDYTVDLPEVTVLELYIVPDVSRDDAHATLAQLRLA